MKQRRNLFVLLALFFSSVGRAQHDYWSSDYEFSWKVDTPEYTDWRYTFQYHPETGTARLKSLSFYGGIYLDDLSFPVQFQINGTVYRVIECGEHSLRRIEFYNVSSLTIPGTITYIGDYAFAGRRFPGSVKFLPGEDIETGDFLFGGCLSVNMFTIPERWKNLTCGTFMNCQNLVAVSLHRKMESVDESAFLGCSSLRNVYCFAEAVPKIVRKSDKIGTWNPGGATLHVPASAIEAYKNAYYWNRFGNIVAISDEEMTGIDVPRNTVHDMEIYTPSGTRTETTRKGINIIRRSDGTIRKVVVKH